MNSCISIAVAANIWINSCMITEMHNDYYYDTLNTFCAVSEGINTKNVPGTCEALSLRITQALMYNQQKFMEQKR